MIVSRKVLKLQTARCKCKNKESADMVFANYMAKSLHLIRLNFITCKIRLDKIIHIIFLVQVF